MSDTVKLVVALEAVSQLKTYISITNHPATETLCCMYYNASMITLFLILVSSILCVGFIALLNGKTFAAYSLPAIAMVALFISIFGIEFNLDSVVAIVVVFCSTYLSGRLIYFPVALLVMALDGLRAMVIE